MRLAKDIRNSGRTFLGYPRLQNLAESFISMNKRNPGGAQVAEFGVGRGGSAMLLAWMINKLGGELYLFDVYSQIPPPSIADGQLAQKRYEQISHSENNNYYGNVNNLLSIIKGELQEICPLEKIHFIVGKFEETLPNYNDNKRFNLVHVDCDWYESTRAVLNFLRNNLNKNAILQIDDYDFWPGTKQAIQETEWLKNKSKKTIEGALIVHLKDQDLWT